MHPTDLITFQIKAAPQTLWKGSKPGAMAAAFVKVFCVARKDRKE